MSDRCPVHDSEYRVFRGMANGLLAPHCSWGGSLHPDTFMEMLERPGTRLTPTDKSYKVYISVATEEPEEMRVVSSTHRTTPPDERGWMTYEEAVKRHPELREEYERHLKWIKDTTPPTHPWHSETEYVQVAPRGTEREDKFYFEHLSEAQRDRFLELLKAGKLNLDYPGHFYVLPFFLKAV